MEKTGGGNAEGKVFSSSIRGTNKTQVESFERYCNNELEGAETSIVETKEVL